MQPNGQKNQIERLIEALEQKHNTVVILNIENITVNQTVDSSTNQHVSSGVMVGSTVSKDTTFNTAPEKSEGMGVAKFFEVAKKATPLVILLALSVSLYVGNPKITNCLTQLTKIVMKE
jgi:hypothetical protein